jgi:hypothetical protein
MSVDLANEIWSELKRYINAADRTEAAEVVVSTLIDNDISADEIKSAFRSDADIKDAVVHYLKDSDEDDEDDEDDNDSEAYDYDDEDEDW